MSGEQELSVAERLVGLVGDRAEAIGAVTRDRHGLTRFANSFVHQNVEEDVTRAALTVAVDGRVASASTTRLGDAELAALVERTLEAAALQPPDPHWPGVAGPDPATAVDHDDPGTVEATPEQRAGLVADFVAAGEDLLAAGFVDTQATATGLATSAGQRVRGRATRATVDGIHRTPTSAGSGHQTSAALGDLDAVAAGARAADLARRSERFVDVEPGTREVVLAPEAVATIVMFLAFYGLNAKQVLDQASFVQLGEQQLDPAIDLRDDVTDPRQTGLGFDLQGTPTRTLQLVADGVPQALAHDRRTAHRMDATSTGHAAQLFGDEVGAVPQHLVLRNGTTPAAELVAGVGHGLLVTSFNYCRVLDPRTLAVTGLTRNGTFLVEDGEVTGAVGNLRFTQSFVDALAPGQVVGVGDDARMADSEYGEGLVVAPSLHLSGWSFSGGADG